VADNLVASDQERRSEIERTLHESERQFRLLVESVADYAIFMLNVEGRIVTWNSGAARIKGYDAADIIGHDHSRFYTEEDRALGLPAQALQSARVHGRHEAEGWRVRKDGGRFWAHVVVEAIRSDDGQLIGFSKVTRDITERREAQARDARFRRVVETAPNAIVMINATGLIEMVNAQAEQIFGYDRSEMLGQHVEMLVPERFRANHPALRRSFLTDPHSRPMGAGRDLFGLRKDGSEFPIEIGLNPIETEEGTMVLSAIVDITARKRLEERFRRVVEAAPSAMVMINAGGRIEMVNAQAEQVFGYARGEMLGQPVEMLVPARFRGHHPGLRGSFFADPKARPMGAGRDLFGLRKDGSEFPVEIGLNPIETDEGPMVLSAIVDISARKRLEERFRRVVEAAPNAMVMINAAGRIEMVNAQAEHVFGYARSEMLGQAVEMLVPERFRGHHPGLRGSFFAEPKARSMGVGRDLFGLRKDGTEFPVEIGLNPIETDEGPMVLSAIVDISARKRLEERFRRVVEAAPNAMVMINASGIIEMVNAQAELMFGYARAEMLGQAVEMLVPVRFRGHHPGLRSSFFSDPKARPMGAGRDLFGMRKDGSEFPVEIGLNPIETDEGPMVLSAVVDISARRRLEERFRLVVEAAPSAMVMINANGRIEMVNAQAEQVFGYARHELLGQPVEMLVPERFRGHHPGLRQSFFAGPQARPMGAGRDLYGLAKDGTEFPVEIGLNPIETEEGPMVLSAIVDISDRKQKEERIQLALKEKDVLLGEVHHRVKNNLQIVHSLLDLQSSRITDRTALAMLRDSQNRIRSMGLIHQTLYQSKDFAKVDFSRFLDSLVPTLVGSYGVNPDRIALSVKAEQVLFPINAAIPCGLIVNELISNALKHAFPGDRRGEIRVGLFSEPDGATVVLSVADDGVGIPDDVDLGKTSTLGLQLVTLLSDQLGGKIAMRRSNPTEFVLSFAIQP
jgi:PAS domain S-box-containing protein